MKSVLTKRLKALGLASIALSLTIANLAFARQSRDSTYEVPQSSMLDEALIVNLKKARLNINGSSASLDYRLPAELDGTNAKRFLLTGSFDGTSWNLSTNDHANSSGDPSVKATCEGNERNFTCVMNYAKNDEDIFPLDTASADSYLQTRTDLTPAEITHIKAAQAAFSHEPIGIIRVQR